jgi:hypothetical protein
METDCSIFTAEDDEDAEEEEKRQVGILEIVIPKRSEGSAVDSSRVQNSTADPSLRSG